MFKCCTLNFDDLKLYLKHLELHKSHTNIQVKCNLCGNNSKTWEMFKRHYKTYHKESKITASLSPEEISSAVDSFILLEEDEIQTDHIIETILNQSKVI